MSEGRRSSQQSNRRRTAGGVAAVFVALATLVSAIGMTGASAASPQSRKSHATTREPMKDFAIQPATLTTREYGSLLNLAQHAGARVISLDISWSSYEPSGPAPVAEWAHLDTFVQDVVGRGLKLRFQLVGFPNWARQAGDSSDYWLAPSSPAELAKWSQFVTRVVTHFGSKITYYEIWNEENISSFWAQGPSPVEYARLLETSYVAIKRSDPGARVMFGGISRNDVGFLQQVYDATGRLFPKTAVADDHFFDILGVHPYSGNRSPVTARSKEIYRDQWGTMDENFLGIERLHDLMVREGEGWKHLYIGEYGFSTAAWEGFAPVPDAARARYLTAAFALAARTGYVDGLCWYYSYVTPWNGASWALLRGSYPDYQPTLTYKALAAVPNS